MPRPRFASGFDAVRFVEASQGALGSTSRIETMRTQESLDLPDRQFPLVHYPFANFCAGAPTGKCFNESWALARESRYPTC